MKNTICAVLLAFGAPLFCASQPGRAAGTGPNKLALLVGINGYRSQAISPLAGSVNDVEDMKALLIGKFDFPPANILVLKNEQATHAAIISAIRTHLIAKARPGDMIVFHFSGHGSQAKNPKKPSGLDETIVPYDSRDPQGNVSDISGSELHGLLVQLSAITHNITFILDSCHSGTLTRGPRTRGIPADTRKMPPIAEYSSGEKGLYDVGSEAVPPFALLAAATSQEVAFEHLAHGQERGALTFFLTQQIRAAKPQSTWRDVMDGVSANVTAYYPGQHPQLEGAQSDQQVFGAAVTMSQSYVLASPLDRSRVALAQGQVSGMTPGSIFDIYPPGTKQFEAKPLGTVQVTSVAEFTSQALLVSGGPVPLVSRAVEKTHRYGTNRLRVYLHEKEKSKTLQALNQALARLPQIEIVADPKRCQLQLEEIAGKISILSADQKQRAVQPVPAGSADAVAHLVLEVQDWVKWTNEMSIGPALPGPDIQLKIVVPQSGAKTGNEDAIAKVGDKVSVEVTNNSAKSLYVYMLDFSTDGSISQIYPTVNGANEVLKPDLSLSKSFTTYLPKYLPPDSPSVYDTVKVFASTKPVDLKPLLQLGTKDIPQADDSDPLNDLFAEAVGIPKGLQPDDSPNADAAAPPAAAPPAAAPPAAAPPAAVSNPGNVANWNVVQKTLRINPK